MELLSIFHQLDVYAIEGRGESGHAQQYELQRKWQQQDFKIVLSGSKNRKWPYAKLDSWIV